MKGWRSGAAGQRTRGCICACLCLHCGVLSTMSGFMMRFVPFFLVQELFFFNLGLKGTERLHRRSTDERERERRYGGKKRRAPLLVEKQYCALFFSSLLASFRACGDVCVSCVFVKSETVPALLSQHWEAGKEKSNYKHPSGEEVDSGWSATSERSRARRALSRRRRRRGV